MNEHHTNIDLLLKALKDPTAYKTAKDILLPHLDDPDYLSEATMQLAALNYYMAVDMAEAEFNENEEIVNSLSMALGDGEKKISVAEAEKRAVVSTKNAYGMLKNQSAAVIEIINTIKKRLELLGWEHQSG